VHTVVATDQNLIDPDINRNARKAARKWLLVDMGMGQHTTCQHGAVGRDHIPSVGIVFPTLVFMAQGHMERIDARRGLLYLNANNVDLAA
jgi:hypothetical protein